jgi:hypothetical protein
MLLSGCPAVMRGIVKNSSNNAIVIHKAGDHAGAYKIASASTQEVFWFRGCITVIENEALHHFDGSKIPNEYISIHMFSTSLKLHYTNNQLSYVGGKGAVVNLPKVLSCKNA